MMRMLIDRGLSIFACDEYSVYSSTRRELSPGPPARVVTENIGSVRAQYGGPWHLALNSEIFVRVWRRVFEDRLFIGYDWTVKVDPDAVFLPWRLREHVRNADPDAHVYLNNCDQGIHGPLEVISRGAMEVFSHGISDCLPKLEQEFTWAGEDVFLRHCLGMLKVNRVDDFRLLSEKACFWEDPEKNGCVSGKVAFHPFKTPELYKRCLDQAGGGKHP